MVMVIMVIMVIMMTMVTMVTMMTVVRERATTRLRAPACVVHWTQECDEALLAAAYRKSEQPARTGACYYHDRRTCPDCACGYYLKVGRIGFDGGTGCLRSLEDLTRELRLACVGQRCEP